MIGIQLNLFSKPARAARKTVAKGDSELSRMWLALRQRYFPERFDLDSYTIEWSKRKQLRTLASCSVHNQRVRVARELNYPEHSRWLSALLYHEMCHAYLEDKVACKKGRYQWHGREFRTLERLHPGIAELDGWIKSGGWLTAVRSDRAKRAHAARKGKPSQK